MKKSVVKVTKKIEKVTDVRQLDIKYFMFLEKMIQINNITEASKYAGFSYTQGRRINEKMNTNEYIQNYINKKKEIYKYHIQEEVKFDVIKMYNRLNGLSEGTIQEEREIIIEGQIHKVKNSIRFKATKLIIDKQKFFDLEFIHSKKIELEKLRIEKLKLLRDLKNDKFNREDSYY